MAVTGILLLGFVIGHLLGNLLVFMGPEALNAYALKLRKLGPGLWVIRFVLLGIVAAHVITAVCLTVENRRARPERYARKGHLTSTLSSRTMALSGFLILAYIVFHLLHFTVRITHPEISHLTDADGHHDVYAMVVLSFSDPVIAFIYVGAMAVLCLHLSHGIASFFQTIGVNNDRFDGKIRLGARVLSLLIFIGYSAIPLTIWAGLLPLPGGHQ